MSIYDSEISEKNVRLAIAEFIRDNESEYMEGLMSSGLPRKIEEVTISAVTPPKGYYYVNIGTGPVDIEPDDFTNTQLQNPAYRVTYTVNINITDYAVIQPTDEGSYDAMDMDMKTFGDRIITSLLMTDTISYGGVDYCLSGLDNDLNIGKTHFSTTWADAQSGDVVFFTQIEFRISQRVRV